MNQKQTLAKKIRNFLDGKGFYLVVLLCVSAVGLSGWYLTRNAKTPTEELVGPAIASASVTDPSVATSEQVSGTAQIVVPTPGVEDVLTVSTPSPVPVIEPETPAEPVVEPDKTDDAPVPLVYTWPVKGNVLMAYSMETLLYDETMGDWRVHTGLDIAATPGANVFAAAAGTVTAVYEDDLMGTTVVVNHGQGMVSTYSNLQSVPAVEAGDTVYTGSILGAVGSTAIAESASESHLHFELTCNGNSVDPLSYLPEL